MSTTGMDRTDTVIQELTESRGPAYAAVVKLAANLRKIMLDSDPDPQTFEYQRADAMLGGRLAAVTAILMAEPHNVWHGEAERITDSDTVRMTQAMQADCAT